MRIDIKKQTAGSVDSRTCLTMRKISWNLGGMILWLLWWVFISGAAQADDFPKDTQEKSKAFIKAAKSTEQPEHKIRETALRHLSAHREVLGLDFKEPLPKIERLDHFDNGGGETVYRVYFEEQRFKEIAVVDTEIVVSINGNDVTAYGKHLNTLPSTLSMTAKIGEEVVKQAVVGQVVYRPGLFVSGAKTTIRDEHIRSVRLIIYPPGKENQKARLAWEVLTSPYGGWRFYFDAQTGELFKNVANQQG